VVQEKIESAYIQRDQNQEQRAFVNEEDEEQDLLQKEPDDANEEESDYFEKMLFENVENYLVHHHLNIEKARGIHLNDEEDGYGLEKRNEEVLSDEKKRNLNIVEDSDSDGLEVFVDARIRDRKSKKQIESR